MKKILIIISLLFVLALGALAAAPFLVPLEVYKEQIVKQVKERTGRELTLAGPIAVTIYPVLGVTAEKVTLSNPPGFSRKVMMDISSLALSMELLPLLKKQVIIKEFELLSPKIHLEKNAKSVANWEFSSSQNQPAKHDEKAGDSKHPLASIPKDFRLGTIIIRDGVFSWKDSKSGVEQSLKDVDVDLSLESYNSPFSFSLAAEWMKKPLDISLQLNDFSDALEGKESGFKAHIKTPLLGLDYMGTFHVSLTKNGVAYNSVGDLAAASESLVALGEWVGVPFSLGGNTPAKFSLDTSLALKNDVIDLKEASLMLDSISANGDLYVNISKDIPYISGSLSTDLLDVNSFIPDGGKNQQPNVAGEQVPATQETAAGWSTTPYNFDWIKTFNADLKIDTKGINYHDVKVGNTELVGTAKDGKLTLNLKQMELYGGTGKGEVIIDTRASAPIIDKFFELKAVNAGEFLRNALHYDRLSGTADAILRARGSGKSQRDIIASLSGGGRITFADGAIKGTNIAAMMREFKASFMGGDTQSKNTDFAELSASYTIRGGIFYNEDLFVKAPVLRITGKGNINILDRLIHYRMVAKLIASLKGQGGKDDKTGLSVPVNVTGPLDAPNYSVDIAGMLQEGLKDPEAVKNTVDNIKESTKDVKQQIKDIKGQAKEVKGLIKGLLGE